MSLYGISTKNFGADLLEGLDDRTRRLNAARAINKVTRDTRAKAAGLIRKEINFPGSYVAPAQRRLQVVSQASGAKLEAVIEAQGRATSLARFVNGGAKKGMRSPTVQVEPGRSIEMKRAFLIPLRAGNALTDTQYNLGLAIRLRPGETLRGKHTARKIASNLYLLYGPSVYQALIGNDGSGIAEDLEPEIVDDLREEFFRLQRVF